jgi:hypothetical protein
MSRAALLPNRGHAIVAHGVYVLYRDGVDVTPRTLSERRVLLKGLLASRDRVNRSVSKEPWSSHPHQDRGPLEPQNIASSCVTGAAAAAAFAGSAEREGSISASWRP